MGVIQIQIRGSFLGNEGDFTSCAEIGGHAMAIQRAIKWLNDQLPEAIILDHSLHDQNNRPPNADFGHSK